MKFFEQGPVKIFHAKSTEKISIMGGSKIFVQGLVENECERAGNPDGDCIRMAVVFAGEVSREQVCTEGAFEKLYVGGGVS